jgi:hypothetical protein
VQEKDSFHKKKNATSTSFRASCLRLLACFHFVS